MSESLTSAEASVLLFINRAAWDGWPGDDRDFIVREKPRFPALLPE
jgi:hypothetical protein